MWEPYVLPKFQVGMADSRALSREYSPGTRKADIDGHVALGTQCLFLNLQISGCGQGPALLGIPRPFSSRKETISAALLEPFIEVRDHGAGSPFTAQARMGASGYGD